MKKTLVDNIPQILFLIFLITLGALEIMAYWQKGYWSTIAVYIWIILGIAYFIATLAQISKVFLFDIRNKFIWGILALIITSSLVLLHPSIFTTINFESTEQAAAAIENVKQQDLNYTGQSFLGYPSRQYLITTLPSFFFKKAPLTLNVGYAYPFILGLFIFYAGLRTFLSKNKNEGFLCALGVLSIFPFLYVLTFVLRFEQSITPLSITLNAAGWFLIINKRPSYINFICMLWIGTLLPNVYTPGLASWTLLILAGLILSVESAINGNYKKSIIWILIIIDLMIFGLLSLKGMNEANSSFSKLNVIGDSSNFIEIVSSYILT